MALNSSWRKWNEVANYGRFERIALGSVLVILSAITVYAIVVAVLKLATDFMLGASFLQKAALQDTFGSILVILILLEFNHSVYVAFTQKSGVIQVRAVVLITVLVIARKLMLQDFGTMSFEALLGFGGLLLALGMLYWLISSADRQTPTITSPCADSNVAKVD